jgi:phosphoenolpyruvate carboxylase
MGSLLGKVMPQDTFEKVESMRHLAKTWREAGAGRNGSAESRKVFDELAAFAGSLDNASLFWVSRAFTHFLAIANAAEAHHRTRVLKMEESNIPGDVHALSHKSDSCGGIFPELFQKGHSVDDIYDALTTQQVELVLTAHPTEVNRRTILEKQRRVQQILSEADAHRTSATPIRPYQQQQLDDALMREIASLWQSDEVSRKKPSPQEEAYRGTLVVETVLWESVPQFLRKLDATMKCHLNKGLPLEVAPLKFASWMGGDRDGNPNVTPTVTREVCLNKRYKAAQLFERDLIRLAKELSITHCSAELRAVVGDSSREPYRQFLQPVS